MVLSLHWLRLLLWCRYNPWPGNFHMPQVHPIIITIIIMIITIIIIINIMR